MAQGVHIVSDVAIAAAGAGVSGITLFRAGGLRHFGNVVMTESVSVIALVALTAVLAGVRGPAHLQAGGVRHNSSDIVAVCLLDDGTADLADLRIGAGGRVAGGVPGGRDHLDALLTAGKADILSHAVAGAAGLRNYGALIPLMTGGLGILAHIGLAAAGAGPGGVTHLGAGGLGYGRHIVMAQRVGVLVRVAETAVGAGVGGEAHLLTGRLCDFSIERMAVGLFQHSAAGQAKLRFSAGSGLAGEMSGGEDALAVLLLADGAGEDHHAVSGAGRIGNDLTLVPGVAQRVGVVRDIGIAAAGAGVSGEAALRAGGSRHNSHIIMAQHVGVVGLVAVATLPAGVSGITHRLAGCRGDGGLVIVAGRFRQYSATDQAELGLGAGGLGTWLVSGCGDGLQIAGVTTLAAVLNHARAVAGGVGDLGAVVPIVAQSIGVIVHVAVTAAGAGVGGVALVLAGGRGHDGLVVVAQCVNIVALEALAAVGAGEDGIAHLLTGGFSRSLHEAVAVGVLQNRTADGAELRSGAGGRSAVLVVGGRQRLAVLVTAVEASVLLQPLAGAGGIDLHCAVIKAMALGLGVAARIGVAAAVADIGGSAAGDAGGRSDIRLVVVAEHSGEIGDLALAALGAFLHGVAGHGAGGGHVIGLPAMVALCGDRLLNGAAVPADVQDLASVLAVGLADQHRLPGVADGVHIVFLLHLAADGADIAVIAQGFAGGAHGVDKDEVVVTLRAILVLAVRAGALLAVAVLLAATALAALAVMGIGGGIIPEPDVGNAVFRHPDALVGVIDLIVDGVLTLLGVAGRHSHGAGLSGVAIADLRSHAGFGEVRDDQCMGLSVHNAVVVSNDSLGSHEVIGGVLAVVAVLHNGETLIGDLREDVHMEIMGLQRLGMGMTGAVAELAVAAAIHDLLMIGRIGILIGHDIIQILGESRGAVVQPVDVLAEAVVTHAHVGIHSAASLAAGFSPVIPGIGCVHARSAV